MKDRMYDSGICEALMANRFHPSNVDKWRGWGFEDMVPSTMPDTSPDTSPSTSPDLVPDLVPSTSPDDLDTRIA